MTDYLFERKTIRVVAMGAGFSGLNLAYGLQTEHKTTMDNPEGWIDFQIYEKNDGVGGTWLENTYPGVSCDLAAHAYVFDFELNPDWSHFYVEGKEILEYIRRTTRKYNLDKFVSFKSKVVDSTWDDHQGVWKLKIEKAGVVIEDYAHVFINGSGILNKWKWPDVPGLFDFKGTLLHSARWNHSVDFRNKNVLLIGNGSSAIQILPRIQMQAAKVYNLIRSPTWVVPFSSLEFTRGHNGNFKYSEKELEEFRNDPKLVADLRRAILDDFDDVTYCMIKKGPGVARIREDVLQIMAKRLNNDEKLLAQLVPRFDPGCRRPTPGIGYIEALQAPNVEVLISTIDKFTPSGVVLKLKSGEEVELDNIDIVICATGFDVSFNPFWPVKGENGISLKDQWSKITEVYLSIAAANMPNYFVFNGPNSPVGHGSVLAGTTAMTRYIYLWLDKISRERIKCVFPKQHVVRDLNNYYQEILKDSVWAEECSSWFKPEPTSKIIPALYPATMAHFWELLSSLRPEDFEIEYDDPKSRFMFFGSGRTKTEASRKNIYTE